MPGEISNPFSLDELPDSQIYDALKMYADAYPFLLKLEEIGFEALTQEEFENMNAAKIQRAFRVFYLKRKEYFNSSSLENKSCMVNKKDWKKMSKKI